MLCKKPVACIKKSLLLAGALLFTGASLYAQSIGPSTIDAAGISMTAGSGITYEYAIGQIAVDDALISPTLVVTPGVLQPQTSTTGISVNPLTSAGLKVFPAPVQSTLFIQPDFRTGGKLQLALYDVTGRLLRRQDVGLNTGGERQSMDVSSFSAGHYMLQVIWISGGITYASGYKLQKLQ